MRSPVQIQVSSGSEVSLISTAERKRRYDEARLKRELAESRVEEAEAKLNLSAGSRAGSVACLDDVRSEGGNFARAQRTTDVGATLPQGRLPHIVSSSHLADPIRTIVRFGPTGSFSPRQTRTSWRTSSA